MGESYLSGNSMFTLSIDYLALLVKHFVFLEILGKKFQYMLKLTMLIKKFEHVDNYESYFKVVST